MNRGVALGRGLLVTLATPSTWPLALAQTALRDGDFARYGAEIALVEAALQRLQVLAPDLAPPSLTPSASPAP